MWTKREDSIATWVTVTELVLGKLDGKSDEITKSLDCGTGVRGSLDVLGMLRSIFDKNPN